MVKYKVIKVEASHGRRGKLAEECLRELGFRRDDEVFDLDYLTAVPAEGKEFFFCHEPHRADRGDSFQLVERRAVEILVDGGIIFMRHPPLRRGGQVIQQGFHAGGCVDWVFYCEPAEAPTSAPRTLVMA